VATKELVDDVDAIADVVERLLVLRKTNTSAVALIVAMASDPTVEAAIKVLVSEGSAGYTEAKTLTQADIPELVTAGAELAGRIVTALLPAAPAADAPKVA
jgi:hypothetical protein